MAECKGTLLLGVLCIFLSQVVQGAVFKRDLGTQKLQKPADSETKDNFDCSGRPDSLWPDISKGCKQYFLCQDGKKTTYQCDEGLLFDAGLRACVIATSVTCPSDLTKRGPAHGRPDWLEFSCQGHKDGFYADIARGCHVYYMCLGENLTRYTCPDNLLFDEKMWVCKPPETYECPEKENKAPFLTKTEKKRLNEIMSDIDEILKEENLQKV